MRRGRRSRERGTAMVVMLIVLVTLGTIAGLTVISVQGGAAQASAQRFSAMALYAAESGAAAAMTWLKAQHHPVTHFTDVLNQTPSGIPGNAIQPGQTGNLLSNDQQGWYEVKILNNVGDKDFDLGRDSDGTIVIQSTGYGPNGAMRRLEWEVHMMGPPTNKLLIVGWRDAF